MTPDELGTWAVPAVTAGMDVTLHLPAGLVWPLRWRASCTETLDKDFRLQVWVQTPRMSLCAGVDYSQDGEWVDVPIVHVPESNEPN